MITSLLVIFLILCAIGLIFWGVQQIPGIPPIVKVIFIVVVGVFLILYAINYVQGGHITLH
jgi:hypothetical protein